MSTPELCEWQIIDEDNGLVMPWLTHPFLAWAKQQDWSDKIAIMFGAGLGDAWLAKKCKHLYIVERNDEWAAKSSMYAADNGATNITYLIRKCNDSDGAAEYYTKLPEGVDFDIIINDDAYRTEICQMAVDYFKGKGGIFICDNWIQSFVWMSPKAEEIMAPHKANVFEQENHTNNDGINKWKTAYWNIPA